MGHSHDHHQHDQDTKNIKVAFFLNLIFTVIELVGGILTNSVAILSDSLHDLGDTLSLGLAWYFQKLANKGRDSRFSYGYGRFSLLGALINSFVLLFGSIFILMETIPRLIRPEETNVEGMMVLAVLGILFNGAAVLRLKKGTSQNERVVSLHLMEDVLGWIAVLIGSIIMYFYDLPIIDPILSLLIAIYILSNVYKNLKSALSTFLQNVPQGITIGQVEHLMKEVDGVHSVHDLHIWSMDGEHHILTAHVVLEEGWAHEREVEVRNAMRDTLHKENIDHATLELEQKGEECELDDC
ncbi:MAG: cation transporter [Flavobacteriales bacterium]|nr:cation transporter [Flavobacteriales bacterium]